VQTFRKRHAGLSATAGLSCFLLFTSCHLQFTCITCIVEWQEPTVIDGDDLLDDLVYNPDIAIGLFNFLVVILLSNTTSSRYLPPDVLAAFFFNSLRSLWAIYGNAQIDLINALTFGQFYDISLTVVKFRDISSVSWQWSHCEHSHQTSFTVCYAAESVRSVTLYGGVLSLVLDIRLLFLSPIHDQTHMQTLGQIVMQLAGMF